MIEVRNLHKAHLDAPTPVLRDVSFTLPTGALGALLGTSGSGKSTLLRCLCGLDGFDGGSVRVDGVRVDAGPASPVLRGRVGLVFQSLELFPHLSVLDNCTLAPRVVKGVVRAEAEVRARDLLNALHVGAHEALPQALSGGQRQRVAIVRALMMEPRVLLYDEPTSALDPALRVEVGRTLRDVAERTGMTQLVVTHDVSWAYETCSPVFTLSDGSIAAVAATGLSG